MTSITWPYWMLIGAVALIVLELFIPSGGILGALSAIALISAIVAAFMDGGVELGLAFMLGSALLIPIVTYLSLKLWPKTPVGRRILNQPQQGNSVLPQQLHEKRTLLGKRGISVTPMLPSGAIKIDGKTVDAISDGIPIESGVEIEVVTTRGNYLVVRPVLESSTEDGVVPRDQRSESNDSADPKNRSTLDQVIPDPFDDSLS